MKRTREEWLAQLVAGETISATFPGAPGPSIGRATATYLEEREKSSDKIVLGDFPEGQFRFVNGSLAGDSNVMLQPVATGSGGSVGQPIKLSNIVQKAQERMQS